MTGTVSLTLLRTRPFTDLFKFNSKGAHFLDEDISLFDAPFFNIGPAEAKVGFA